VFSCEVIFGKNLIVYQGDGETKFKSICKNPVKFVAVM